jgi:hypothetical protein
MKTASCSAVRRPARDRAMRTSHAWPFSGAKRLALPETRAQVISSYFVFAYSGLAIPVIGVGVAADHVGDFRAVLGCSIVLALLCALAAAGISGGDRAGRPRARGSV